MYVAIITTLEKWKSFLNNVSESIPSDAMNKIAPIMTYNAAEEYPVSVPDNPQKNIVHRMSEYNAMKTPLTPFGLFIVIHEHNVKSVAHTAKTAHDQSGIFCVKGMNRIK